MSYLVRFSGYENPKDGDWMGNGYRFSSEAEASAYGGCVASRWNKVKKWEGSTSNESVNAKWQDGHLWLKVIESSAQSWMMSLAV